MTQDTPAERRDDTAASADVFISYSSHDRDKVAVLADAMTKSGLNVWWDRSLLPGDSYEATIERALKEAKAVIVCWTPTAAASDWVRSEADDARVNGKLVPVMIEACQPPKPFDRIHFEDLSGWRGNRDHHAYQELEEAVRARVEGRVAKTIPWKRKWITRGALVSLLAMIGVAAANVSLIRDMFFDNDVSTDEVEDLVAREVAKILAQSGGQLDARSEDSLRDALSSVLRSSDAEKAQARQALAQGDVEGAADSLAAVAAQQAEAATGAVKAAAQSWREAGALYAASDTHKAVDAYEKALALDPDNPEILNGLGPLYERQARMDEAQALYTKVLEGAGATDPSWKAKALGNLALMDANRGQYEEAIEGVKEALAIFEAQRDQEAVAKAYLNLGNIYDSAGDRQTAESYAKRCLTLARELGLRNIEAAALGNIAYVRMRGGDYDTARATFDEAIAIMDDLGMETEKSYALLNLTLMLSNEGKIDEAEAMARKTLALAEKLDAKITEAGALNHLAIIARERGEYETAEARHKEAIALFQSLQSPENLYREYTSYARTAEAMQEPELAIERYRLALEQADILSNVASKASTTESIARIHAGGGELDKAKALILQNLEMCDRANEPYCYGSASSFLAKIHLNYGETQEAVDSFEQAALSFADAGEAEASAESYLEIGSLALSANRPDIALQATEDALSVIGDMQSSRLRATALSYIAEASLMAGNFDTGIEAALETVAFVNSQYEAFGPLQLAEAQYLLARAYEQAEQYSDAVVAYDALISTMQGGDASMISQIPDVQRARDAVAARIEP